MPTTIDVKVDMCPLLDGRGQAMIGSLTMGDNEPPCVQSRRESWLDHYSANVIFISANRTSAPFMVFSVTSVRVSPTLF